MFFFALSSTALAVPDIYVYENFLRGWTQYTFPSGNGFVNEQWEKYNFSNNPFGIVASFDNVSMNGDPNNTAVPLVNMDEFGGSRLSLSAGQVVAVYSKGYSIRNLYVEGDCFLMSVGGTSPIKQWKGSNFLNSKNNKSVTFTGSSATSLSDTSFKIDVSTGDNVVLSYGTSESNSSSPYSFSVVYLIYCNSGTSYFSSTQSPTSTLDSPSISWDSLEWFCCGTSDIKSIEACFLPYINGDIDVYTGQVGTYSSSSSNPTISYNSFYRFNLHNLVFDSSNKLVTVNLANFNNNLRAFGGCVRNNFIDEATNFIPIFLHGYNASRYASNYAVYVYDGYFSIKNYDELIQKLKDAGFGSGGSSGDLSEIISLLDQINTGGLTGENAKALIDALEQSHQPIVDNGNIGWNSTKEMFEAYKQLFDFSGSSLHWIVVANNALFNIFSGIIMMCCVFIVFGRVFKS